MTTDVKRVADDERTTNLPMTRRTNAGGLRAGTWVALLAVVALLPTGWWSVDRVQHSRQAQATATEAEQEVERYVTLNALRAALMDERNYAGALAALESFGLQAVVVRQVTGIDVDGRLEAARGRVDAVLADLGDEQRRLDVEAARDIADEGAVEGGRGYAALQDSLAAQLDATFLELRAGLDDFEDSAPITRSLRSLEATTLARQEMAALLNLYFGVQFDGGSGGSTRPLIETWARYEEAMRQTQRAMGAESLLSGAYVDLAADDTTQQVKATVDRLLSDAPAKGSIDRLPQQDLSRTAEDFALISASAAAHLDLVEAAADDLRATIDSLRVERAGDARRALLLLAIAAVALTTYAITMSRAFAVPLRRLAGLARSLGEDDAPVQHRPTGPTEVRQATIALQEAAQHLHLVEGQAHALARGDLESDALRRRAPGAIGASLQEAVQTLASSLAEREDFRRRLAHEASTDGLTQLANRNASLNQLTRSLARARRSGTAIALLYVDLDGFKELNDIHGHPVGDLVLRTVARRIVASVREGDHVGRLAGDQFVVIAEPAHSVEDTLALARRVQAAISAPLPLERVELHLTASIGIAIGASDEYTGGTAEHLTADELLRDADLAVYQAKTKGRGGIELCNEQLRTQLAADVDLELAIRRALSADELVMHYQPIVDGPGGAVIGAEALVRWARPGHGVLSPAAFIPFAERSDLIVEVDRWVLRAVISQLSSWTDSPAWRHRTVSVNVSGRTLNTDGFVADVLGPLREHGVDPARLVIEVTESALLDDLSVAARRLQELRGHGVRTAIDDFGTGYTSLAHLKTLPIDILKIDRSFTVDPSAASLVKLIIDTGHLLGAVIVAEGIETAEQARRLEELGSDELQGYLFGRPAAPADLPPELVTHDAGEPPTVRP